MKDKSSLMTRFYEFSYLFFHFSVYAIVTFVQDGTEEEDGQARSMVLRRLGLRGRRVLHTSSRPAEGLSLKVS